MKHLFYYSWTKNARILEITGFYWNPFKRLKIAKSVELDFEHSYFVINIIMFCIGLKISYCDVGDKNEYSKISGQAFKQD